MCLGARSILPKIVRVDIESEELIRTDLDESILSNASQRCLLVLKASNSFDADFHYCLDALARHLGVDGLVAAVGHVGGVGAGHYEYFLCSMRLSKEKC